MDDGIQLEHYIKALRSSLMKAMQDGKEQPLKFRAEEITLELVIGASSKTKGSGGIKFEVFGLGFNAGGDHEKGATNTQKLTLKLKPVSGDGSSDDPLISDHVDLE